MKRTLIVSLAIVTGAIGTVALKGWAEQGEEGMAARQRYQLVMGRQGDMISELYVMDTWTGDIYQPGNAPKYLWARVFTGPPEHGRLARPAKARARGRAGGPCPTCNGKGKTHAKGFWKQCRECAGTGKVQP